MCWYGTCAERRLIDSLVEIVAREKISKGIEFSGFEQFFSFLYFSRPRQYVRIFRVLLVLSFEAEIRWIVNVVVLG